MRGAGRKVISGNRGGLDGLVIAKNELLNAYIIDKEGNLKVRLRVHNPDGKITEEIITLYIDSRESKR